MQDDNLIIICLLALLLLIIWQLLHYPCEQPLLDVFRKGTVVPVVDNHTIGAYLVQLDVAETHHAIYYAVIAAHAGCVDSVEGICSISKTDCVTAIVVYHVTQFVVVIHRAELYPSVFFIKETIIYALHRPLRFGQPFVHSNIFHGSSVWHIFDGRASENTGLWVK